MPFGVVAKWRIGSSTGINIYPNQQAFIDAVTAQIKGAGSYSGAVEWDWAIYPDAKEG